MKKQLLITLLATTLCGSIQAANIFRKIVAGATAGAISALTLGVYYNSQKTTFPPATKKPANTLRAYKLNSTTPEETTQNLRKEVLKTNAQIFQDHQKEVTTTQNLRSKVL